MAVLSAEKLETREQMSLNTTICRSPPASQAGKQAGKQTGSSLAIHFPTCAKCLAAGEVALVNNTQGYLASSLLMPRSIKPYARNGRCLMKNTIDLHAKMTY